MIETKLDQLPLEAFCNITHYLDVAEVLKLKEVCKDFFWKLNGCDHMAIADTQANRRFVAEKMIDMTEFDHMAEEAVKATEKVIQAAAIEFMPGMGALMSYRAFTDEKKKKLKHLYTDLFTNKTIPQTIELYVNEMTASELLAVRAFNETSAGKKLKNLTMKLQEMNMREGQEPEFQRKVQAILMS